MFKKVLFITILSYFSYLSYANPCLDIFEKTAAGVLNPKIFRANDIRGIYKEDFTLDLSETLGKTLVSLVKKNLSIPISEQSFVIGFDAREGGPELAKNLADTLLKQGATVSVVGLVPTPLVYSLVHNHNTTAGIIITARS